MSKDKKEKKEKKEKKSKKSSKENKESSHAKSSLDSKNFITDEDYFIKSEVADIIFYVGNKYQIVILLMTIIF